MFSGTRIPRYICRRCLRQYRRSYATSTPSAETPRLFRRVHLPNRRLLSVSGVDAPKFLQGLTTNNVDSKRTEGWYTAFLHAQGRVLYEGFVYPTSETAAYQRWLGNSTSGGTVKGREEEEDWSCLIDVDTSEIKSLAKHLKRHKLRSKVNIRVVDEGEWDIWAVGQARENSEEELLTLEDSRAPSFGSRVVAPSSAASKLRELYPEEDSLEVYQRHRYLAGIPEGPQEIIRGQALPIESNIDLMGGIDFKKGCYVGQELTIRTVHTGIVRKRILPVQLYLSGSSPPSTLAFSESEVVPMPLSGAEISIVPGDLAEEGSTTTTVRRRGRARGAGDFLSGIGNVGLALCRLETMTDLRLTTEGGGWKPDLEFEIKWTTETGKENRVRTKAFVPEWHKERARTKPHRKSTSGFES